MKRNLHKWTTKFEVSDNKYLFILSSILILIAILTLVWFIPYKILDSNFAANIFTSCVFTVFTIVFLTYVIDNREKKRWKAVEERILQRIGYRLYNLSDIIDFYFLFSTLPEKYEKRIKENAPTTTKDYEHYKAQNRIIVEYYATHLVYLGELGISFFETFSSNSIQEIKELFEKEEQYFEHVVSEYFLFLSPIQVNSIMAIVDDIGKITKSCDDSLRLVGIRKDYDVCKHQFDEAKIELEEEIHRIFERMNILNEIGLGF